MGVAPCEIWKSLSSREFSSAGRASALQAEGQRFDPVNSHRSRSVAVITSPCHGEDRGFDSRRDRKITKVILDSLAQLVEQLTFNQWVTGSSPVRVIFAGLAELADAPDLGSGA